MPGPGLQVEISDSIELCIVELTRVDCISKSSSVSTFVLLFVLGCKIISYRNINITCHKYNSFKP